MKIANVIRIKIGIAFLIPNSSSESDSDESPEEVL